MREERKRKEGRDEGREEGKNRHKAVLSLRMALGPSGVGVRPLCT